MDLPDANVLLYAFRADSEHHGACRAWLNAAVLSDASFGVSRPALGAVVRIATNRRAFDPPSDLADAFGFCQDILDQPHCRPVEPGERHWDIFRRLCEATATTGPWTTDAWFAALAIESGCTWITMDRDFARFPGLAWRTP
ncbi:MAG TPA: type II toxin-antitoxin system VapC family toxin [Caulobacteraceae bacterium]|nr:type II toxin-antitoxin system VapC family toxin [Caulobacteraceae bacterium]